MTDIQTPDSPAAPVQDAGALFQPFSFKRLRLRNRVVMAPMTRALSPGGVPHEGVARYYARRAAEGVALIITEGTWIPHAGASNEPGVPNFHGEDALQGWGRVAHDVHAAGGLIFPQLWHVGQQTKPQIDSVYQGVKPPGLQPGQIGPSGVAGGLGHPLERTGEAMSQADIDDVIEAYATAAQSARRLGFDGVELHGAHGYLIDQFFWDQTNLRQDIYGGSAERRARFAADTIAEVRRRTSDDFPIVCRISQFKLQDYAGRIANTPRELELLLAPLVEAGVDALHCSQRRFWEPEFPGSDLNFAGWVKKLTGLPTITVGSVSLDSEFMESLQTGTGSKPASIGRLLEMLERGDFDLVAVGRALISDPTWVTKVRSGHLEQLVPFSPACLAALD